MRMITDFYFKHRKRIFTVSLILLVILFIMSFITMRRVNIRKRYTDTRDVALYLIEFHELPSNYVTKSGYTAFEKHGKLMNGYIIGGDSFANTGELEDFGVSYKASLKECDIEYDGYVADGKRGKERLVYTCNTKNVRVFYTDDHYSSFKELTRFSLQLVRNIFIIVFFVYLFLFGLLHVGLPFYAKKKESEKPRA